MRAWILWSCLLAAPVWATEPRAVGKSREEPAQGPSVVSGKAEEEVRKAEQEAACRAMQRLRQTGELQ